ncbi:flagellin [Paracoccus sp. S1E-3]|uniref:flagellin N-terminal helical domain-containing protein n=1 Tax=Paracoccus sp. S1E-3 TaxID=2756130 RepID=UPI0015EE4E25|nr:flagellin [Paracoccus sp. S1E-3]MBA4492292.1 flagellin [Paracoccus sp. S1E-3]
MSSILTNNGAMVALQTLKGINSSLAKTQDQISTGKDINNAKDDAAIWAISKVMESDVGGFKAVSKSLSLASGAISTATKAAESVQSLITEIGKKVASAKDGNLDRATLQADVVKLKAQIETNVKASQFNGINLVNGDQFDGASTFKALSALNRAQDGTVTADTIDVDLSNTDLRLTGGTVAAMTDLAALDLTAVTDWDAALATVNAAFSAATDAATAFGGANKRIEIQSSFISQLSDSMTSAVGALVDADMEEASARLQALQTQQQLGVQALSIANQAPKSLLSLFRG